MLPTEPNHKDKGTGKPMTRRQLLASMGAAGVLLAAGAAGAGFPGEAQAASSKPAADSDSNLVFNVKDYGALGNGRFSQDDGPYIQSAINAASAAKGGTVFLPPGDYVIKSSLIMRSRVHLVGAGEGAATIRVYDPDVQMVKILASVSQCSIEGISFEGIGAGSASTIPLVECGVYITEGEHIRINRCTFNKVASGVHIIRAEHVSVTDCSFTFIVGSDSPYEGYGVTLEGGSNNIIQANQFSTVYKTAILVNAGSSYSIIAGNLIEGCQNEAILLTSKLSPCAHHLIQGNLISAAKQADQQFSSSYGIRMKDYCSYNTIANNVISRSALAGIQLDAPDNAGDDRPYGNTITGNTVNTTVRGISVLNGDANTVKGNEVRRAETGVLLDTIGEASASSAKQNIVTGNSLFQCTEAAVRIGSARCSGNTVFGNAGSDNAAGLSDAGTDTATAGF